MRRDASFLPPFLPLDTPARWTIACLVASLAAAWVSVGVELAHLRLLTRAAGGAQVATDARMAQFQTNSIFAGVQLVLLAATAVAFLLWLFQARVNLRALGVRRLRFTRAWTVWSFLVPVLNAFRPYQVVREVWQASQPGNLDPFRWRDVPVPALVPLWWAACVTWASLELLALVLGVSAGVSLPKLQLATSLAILADVAAAGGALCAAFLVARLTAAQHDKWNAQQRSSEEAPA